MCNCCNKDPKRYHNHDECCCDCNGKKHDHGQKHNDDHSGNNHKDCKGCKVPDDKESE